MSDSTIPHELDQDPEVPVPEETTGQAPKRRRTRKPDSVQIIHVPGPHEREVRHTSHGGLAVLFALLLGVLGTTFAFREGLFDKFSNNSRNNQTYGHNEMAESTRAQQASAYVPSLAQLPAEPEAPTLSQAEQENLAAAQFRSMTLALVTFDEDLFELAGPRSIGFDKAEERLWSKLEEQIRFWEYTLPHFEDLSANRRAALVYLSFEARGSQGNFDEDFADVLLSLNDQRWRKIPDEWEQRSAKRDKWSSVATALQATKWCREVAPLRGYRICQMLLYDSFHSSIERYGRENYRKVFARNYKWFKGLSPSRQLAVMELTLALDVSPDALLQSYPIFCGSLAAAVDAEQSQRELLAKESYASAAFHAGPKGGNWNKREENLGITSALERMILEDVTLR